MNIVSKRFLSLTRPLFQFRDINEYHKVANETMERLLDQLWEVEEKVDVKGYDVEYSSGVMTLKLGPAGTYVINKQPPNEQIWLSSPISGPKRFDYDKESKRWIYHRDSSNLESILSKELSEMLKRKIDIQL